MARILIVEAPPANLRLAEGFDGYLEKPIRYKAFLASVAEMLEGGNE